MGRVAVAKDVREAVLAAATRMMETYGFRKMTMDDVAREAGIGKATIYGYFANKEDLALSVIDRYYHLMVAGLRGLAAEEISPAERLRRMARHRVLFAFDVCGRYRQGMDDALANLKRSARAQRQEHDDEVARLFVQVLNEGCATGMFDCSDLDAAARTVVLALNGLMPYNLVPADFEDRDCVRARTDLLIDMLLSGLLAR